MARERQPRLLINFVLEGMEFSAEISGSQILPRNDRSIGLSFNPVPGDERRPLAGQPDGDRLMSVVQDGGDNFVQCSPRFS